MLEYFKAMMDKVSELWVLIFRFLKKTKDKVTFGWKLKV